MVETLGDILPYAAKTYADKTGLISDGRRFSFNELEALSNAFANSLAGLGVSAGDRVTLYGPNSWQWMVGYYGIAKTGAVVNPVNALLTAEEVVYIVKDSGARILVGSTDQVAPFLDMRATGLSQVVAWGESVPAAAASFNRWLEQGSRFFTLRRRTQKDPGAICYTSGTTGHPKGAVQSQRSIIAAA
jgi:long-chain acyl-CoA synthetase